jgi:predicted nuclease of predicted toxin-antitoxin system
MKFLADMGISPRTVDFLTKLGYDATHLYSEGFERLPDPDILAKALREERIVLTHDLDFGELVAASRSKLPSVITFRLRNMHPDRVNGYMTEIIEKHEDVLEQGAVISITEGKLRVRMLPIKDDHQA